MLGWGRLWLTNRRLVWTKNNLSFPWWTGRETVDWPLDQLSEVGTSLAIWGVYGALVFKVGNQTFFVRPYKWTSQSVMFTSGSLSKRIAALLQSARREA